jgi:hypothetical protein
LKNVINQSTAKGHGSNKRIHFQEIPDPTIKELYKKKMKPPKSSVPYSFPLDTAIQKLHNEPFAIHDEAIALYPLIEKTFSNEDKCAITEIELFAPEMTYTVIQKRTPYRRLLEYG